MDIIPKLLDLVVRLYDETEGYLDNQSDVQLWYNRGYANGMVATFRESNLMADLESRLKLDDVELHQQDTFMAWTKAYHHGFEMGKREAQEVLIERSEYN